jgi:YHS domain-containing protein
MTQVIRDPVCRTRLNPARLRWRSRYQDSTHYFCSTSCKSKFDKSPETYVENYEDRILVTQIPTLSASTRAPKENREARVTKSRTSSENGRTTLEGVPTIIQLRSWALVILGIGAIIAFCYFAKPVIIPFILALYLSYILSPLVSFATHRLKIPHTIASILAVLLALTVILTGLYFLIGQVQNFMEDFPKYSYKLRTLIGGVQKEVKQIQEKTEDLTEKKDIPEVKIANQSTNYLKTLTTTFDLVSTFVLVLFFVLFLLKDQIVFKKKLITIASYR